MQMVLIITLFIWPALIGGWVAFQRQPDRWHGFGGCVAIAPAATMLIATLMISTRGKLNFSDLVMILILTLIAGLFFFLARRLAKPFAEAWREHRDAKVEETFK
ncbi:MAG: hypothetical protein NXH88_02850 [Hyphomonas sp.]|nr:hypothetical protein [Hyphomonas sp.]